MNVGARNKSLRSPRLIKDERGVAFPLLAILIPTFIAFIALVIDIKQLLGSADFAESYANLAALAGAEAYHGTSCFWDDEQHSRDECHPVRLAKAIERMQEISEGNLIFNVESGEIGEEGGETPSWLEVGKWWTTALEDEQASCAAQNEAAPCFVTFDAAQHQGFPNAFKVHWRYDKDASAFTRAAFNLTSFPLKQVAIAKLVSRRGVVLLDGSRSTAHMSHAKWRTDPDGGEPAVPLCGQGHQYSFSFARDSDQNSGIPTCSPDPCDAATEQLFDHDDPVNGLMNNFGYQRQWEWLRDEHMGVGCPAVGDPVPCPLNMNIPHCADDYILKRSLGDNDYYNHPSNAYENFHPSPTDYPSTPGGQWVAIDAKVDSDPQPLSTVFASVRWAIEEFKRRQTSGDKIAVAVYDSRLEWPRMTELSDNWDYLLELIDFNNTQDVGGYQFGSDVGWITTPPGPTDPELHATVGRERAIRHLMFPLGNTGTASFLALQYAMNQFFLDENNGIRSADFVALFTDGLDNCIHCPSGLPVEYEHPFTCVDDTQNCSNTYQNHRNAMREVGSFVQNIMIPARTPLHVMLTGGEDIGGHTMEIRNSEGKCHTQKTYLKEYLQDGVFVDDFTGWVAGITGEAAQETAYYDYEPYFEVNAEWWPLVALSQGHFAALRPPETECFADIHDAEGRPRALCPTNPARALNDPYCRGSQAQAIEFMQKILGENPFSIVNPDANATDG